MKDSWDTTNIHKTNEDLVLSSLDEKDFLEVLEFFKAMEKWQFDFKTVTKEMNLELS